MGGISNRGLSGLGVAHSGTVDVVAIDALLSIESVESRRTGDGI